MLKVLVAVLSIAIAIPMASATTNEPARVALVVGIAQYKKPLKPLANPIRDARKIAEVLALNNFVVSFYEDLNHAEFERAVDDFAKSTKGAREAVIFFSGHGMAVVQQSRIINALAPTDAEIDCASRNATRVMGMELILERLTHIPKKIALFDACRSDPFVGCTAAGSGGYGFREISVSNGVQVPPTVTSRSTGPEVRGLEPRNKAAQSQMLISYASDLGGLALDGTPGQHSPFAEALLGELQVGDKISFGEILDKTSQRVASSTKNFQIPWVVARGGEPDMCLAESGCEARGKLRQDRLLSDAMGAGFDAQRMRADRDLHGALERTLSAVEGLTSARAEIPISLLREFQELLVTTPKRQLVLVEDLTRIGVQLESGGLGRVKFSDNGRIGLVRDKTGNLVLIDFDNMQVLNRFPSRPELARDAVLSSQGDRAALCDQTFSETKCTITRLSDGAIEKTFELAKEFFPNGKPKFSPDGSFVAISGRIANGPNRGDKIVIESSNKLGRRATIALPRETKGKAESYFQETIFRISPNGKSIAALSPSGLHLFQDNAGAWTGVSLDNVFEELGERHGYNNLPSFDFDFDAKRYAFATPAIAVVIGDVEEISGRLVSKQRFLFRDCVGCSVLGFSASGRQLVLAGLGTDGYVGAFSLPLKFEFGKIEEMFRIRQTAREGHYAKESDRIAVFDVNGSKLQILKLGEHPIRRYFFLRGRDQLYAQPGRTSGSVVIYDALGKTAFDFNPRTGEASGRHTISESKIFGQPVKPSGRLFLLDDRYGKSYGRDRIVAAASGNVDAPNILFHIPAFGTGPNKTAAAADDQTLVHANDGNGRIDVLSLPIGLDEQMVAARNILGAGSGK